MLRILIADDHGLYRRGLRIALEASVSDVTVIEADSMDAVLTILEEGEGVDIALIDLNMHGIISFDVLKEVRESYQNTRFVIVSASRSRADILEALRCGLHGFICKAQSEAEITAAISDVISGRIYVPPLLAKSISEMDFNNTETPPTEQRGTDRHFDVRRLTPRQREVLKLMAEGLSNKEIARRLSIAEATTKIHAGALMRVLGVRNRTEAAVLVKSWMDEDRS